MSAPTHLRLALAQLNPIVGDIDGNRGRIAEAIETAAKSGAQIVVFPELAICGYPPEDLLLREAFLQDCRDAIESLADGMPEGIVAVVGWPERDEDVYNAAAVLSGGEVVASYRKQHLPNYGVFDELRYFQHGPGPATIEVAGHTVGVTICEDIWQPSDPLESEALAGARLILNLSASPYDLGKGERRERMLVTRARDNLAAIAYCGLVGGQDELVFDGRSAVIGHDGTVLARGKAFEEDLLLCDLDLDAIGAARLRDTRRRRPPVRWLRACRRSPRSISPSSRAAHPASTPASRSRPDASRRPTPRSCWARATTCARTALAMW